MNAKTYQRGLYKRLVAVAGLVSRHISKAHYLQRQKYRHFAAQATLVVGLLVLAGKPVSSWAGSIDAADFMTQPAASQPESASTPPCPVKPVYPIPTDLENLDILDGQLDALASSCLRSATFYAWHGAVLLAKHKTTAAIEALERALLLDPDLPGAQLDYIDALLAIGDTASARGWIEQFAQRPDLPSQLRPLLEQKLTVINPQLWRTRWTVTTSLGVDTNLNNAPSVSEVTLTFPRGPVTLALLESSRPQNGTAALNIVQWQGLKPQGEQLWLLQAELRARHTAESATRHRQADIAVNWLQAHQAPNQWIARAGLTRIDFGGQQLLQSSRASLMHQRTALHASFPSLACRPSAGFELEYRRYPASSELNGRYAGLVGAINCSGSASLSVQLRLGSDRADGASRPGGDYRRAELRTIWEAHYGLFKLSADYGYTRQLDSSGYSTLLNSSLPRQASRHSLRAEIAHQLPPSWLSGAEGFVSAEINQQTSNLSVFESSQKAIYAGLRWTLP